MKSMTELRTEEKTLKKGTAALVGLLIVIIVTCVYSTVNTRTVFVLVLPFFFFPMILRNIFKIRKLTKEIKTRK